VGIIINGIVKAFMLQKAGDEIGSCFINVTTKRLDKSKNGESHDY